MPEPGGQREKSWKPYGDARVSVASDADANNSETQRPALADRERSSRTGAAGPLGTDRG